MKSSNWVSSMVFGRRILGVFGVMAILALGGCGKSEVANEGGPPNFRRLTETQYRNIIADIFGSKITVGGHFDPMVRTNGLLQVGARTAPVTPAGFEEYDRLARAIAAQIVAPGNRDFLLQCAPKSVTAADDACAGQFYGTVGEFLYRRPLTPAEIQIPVLPWRRRPQTRPAISMTGWPLASPRCSRRLNFFSSSTRQSPTPIMLAASA